MLCPCTFQQETISSLLHPCLNFGMPCLAYQLQARCIRSMLAFPVSAGFAYSRLWHFTRLFYEHSDCSASMMLHIPGSQLLHIWQTCQALLNHLHRYPQVKRAIGWLRVRDRERELQVESKLAACLILKEMAQNSPAVFNVHVKGFIDVIWNSLRHPSREIREAAVQALSVRLSSSPISICL